MHHFVNLRNQKSTSGNIIEYKHFGVLYLGGGGHRFCHGQGWSVTAPLQSCTQQFIYVLKGIGERNCQGLQYVINILSTGC